jgi:hypothetical protein
MFSGRINATDIDDLEYWTGTIKPQKKSNRNLVINTIDELIKLLACGGD